MKTAICAILKDEHLFLEEWIEWHLGLGFDAIHLFEDKGSKSHEEICAKYSNVCLRRYENDSFLQELLNCKSFCNKQDALYNWFGDSYCYVYDWITYIDIDEFITFSCNYDLKKLCEEFSDYSAVMLNWKMIGASGHISRPKCGVLEAYTVEEKPMKENSYYMYKSFCNMHKWRGIYNVHNSPGYVNTNHNEDTSEWCYDKAWINHYFTKSWEDWCDRIFKRGDIMAGHRKLSEFFESNPDMLYLKDELMSGVSHIIPKGTYWIDKNNGLIAGGNVKVIQRLNNTKNTHAYNKLISKPVDDLVCDFAIYYIATSNYKMGFKHFKENICHFYPNYKKVVIVLSDGLSEWDNVEEDGGNVIYKVYHIDHYCWPIITLFKMQHILNHKINCKYAAYFNGNLQYNPNVDMSLYDLSKLNVSTHIYNPSDDYIMGGIFFGDSNIFYKMCEDVSIKVENCLLTNFIPEFHDETLLNEWVKENQDIVNKPQQLMSHNSFVQDVPFAIIETIEKDRRTNKRFYK